MAAYMPLRTLRGILRELRLASPSKGPTRSIFGYQFLLDEYRGARNADKLTSEALLRVARNYLCLLKHERMKQELQEQYKGRGERSVEDVAKLVGFELPKEFMES